MNRLRLNQHDADDMLQGFITSQVLEKEILCRADSQRGRFRTFLLVALDRYAISQYRSRRSQLRALAAGVDAQSVESCASSSEASPCDTFDLDWAQEVLNEAIQRMHRHCQTLNRLDLWTIFELRVLRPTLDHVPPVSYAQLLEQFHYVSPSQASNAVLTAKRMFVRTLRSVIGEYEPDEQQVDAEIADLRRILSLRRA